MIERIATVIVLLILLVPIALVVAGSFNSGPLIP